VGDVNVMPALLESRTERTALVTLGTVRIAVPPAPLAHLAPGTAVDLFVRPEQLRIAEPGEPAVAAGTVTTQIYQGGHVDLYVETTDQTSSRLLVRLPGHDAVTRWPVRTSVRLATTGADAAAFPRD
jgi:putative spermidine/putrescine transport system ATP-binding protein/spermidine/putrescine transport system ATP-binding protein